LYGTPDALAYAAFARHGLHVVQVLRCTESELPAQARALPPAVGLLVECGRGALPGGNGAAWNWGAAAIIQAIRPFAVAGGLDSTNVAQALAASGASAVDISTGVETAPGIKDLGKVKAFVAAVRAAGAVSRGSVFRSTP
jgi:phosphoribosylanthranilate isomerase